MLIAIICLDKPGKLDVRMKARPQHLEWLQGYAAKLTFAGPLLGDDGNTPIGSLIVGDFESLEAARTIQKADPYTQAGLFESVTIQPTRKTFPA